MSIYTNIKILFHHTRFRFCMIKAFIRNSINTNTKIEISFSINTIIYTNHKIHQKTRCFIWKIILIILS